MLGLWKMSFIEGLSAQSDICASIQGVYENTTMNDLARNILRISATLEDRQLKHQSTMIEIEDIISNEVVSVLIDHGASLGYIG